MKILIITKTLSEKDGQGRYAISLINQLKDKVDLKVFSPDTNNLLGDVSVIEIPDLNTKKDVKSLIKYRKIFTKYVLDCDIVHFFTDVPKFLALSKIESKPYFLTAHGTNAVTSLDHKIYKILLKSFYKNAKKVICVSQYTQKQILKRIKLENTVVINNGIDFKKFNCLAKQNQSNQKVILSVGALKNRKGYDVSIKAIAKVKQNLSNIKYYIVGNQSDNNYFNHLKNIVKDNGVEEDIEFLENISDDELINLYQRCDLFLLTPKVINENKFEGFGLVYLEAGACKKPVIGTKSCGAEDAIKDNYNGLLVPQDDVEQTAQAIEKVLTDNNLATELGKNGQLHAMENDWQKVSQKYLELYESSTN